MGTVSMGVPLPKPLGRQDICRHEHRVPVELLFGGEVVALLCLVCDAQLDAGWVPRAGFCPFGGFPALEPVYDLTLGGA